METATPPETAPYIETPPPRDAVPPTELAPPEGDKDGLDYILAELDAISGQILNASPKKPVVRKGDETTEKDSDPATQQ